MSLAFSLWPSASGLQPLAFSLWHSACLLIMAPLYASAPGSSPGHVALRFLLPSCDLWEYSGDGEGGGPFAPRPVLDVTWNAEFTVVNITYEAKDCEGGEGDTCDIDAVTLICSPGAEGTIESCDVSN